jgi:hypothetical protein
MLGCMTKASEWAQRVAAWRASGLSARDFCRELEYSGKDLQWWSSRLRRIQKPADAKRVPLARVVRDASAPPPSASSIVVELGGARVQLAAGADHATLVAVFEALRASAGGGRR